MGHDVSVPLRAGLPTLPASALRPTPRRRPPIDSESSPFRPSPTRMSSRTYSDAGVTPEQLHKLVETSVAAASDATAGALFQRIEGLICNLLDATSVRLFYVSHWHRKLLHFVEESNVPSQIEGCVGGEWEDCTFWLPGLMHSQVADLNGSTNAAKAARTGESVYVENCTWNSNTNGNGVKVFWPMVHLQSGNGDQQEASSTLAVAEIYRENGRFRSDLLHLLSLSMFMATSWVHRTLTSSEDMARCRAAEALLCICQISPKGMDLEDLVDEIVTAALYFTEADLVRLYFVDELEGELWTAAGRAPVIPLGRGLAGTVASTGKPLNSPNCAGDSRYDPIHDAPGAHAHTAICMPIPPPDIHVPPDNPPKLPSNPSVRRRSAFNLRELRTGLSDIGEGWHRRVASTGASSTGNGYFDPLHRRHTILRTQSSLEVTPRNNVLDTFSTHHVKRHRSPTAVLLAYNKRGGEVFEQLDEDLMRLFCTEAEVLLQQKAAEATMLKRRRHSQGQDNRDSIHARMQSSILSQYATPIDIARFMQFRNPKNALNGVSTGNLAGEDGHSRDLRDFSDSGGKEGVLPGMQLVNWELNPFRTETEIKCRMVEAMYHKLGFSQVLNCDDEVLRRFVRRVKEGYSPLPFHNFDHAFSVAHVTFMMIETAVDIKRHLTPLDLLSALTAAFCHDLDHPGNNNTFEVNSCSPLALLHSDDSVLERHHVHVAFRILLEDGAKTNILGKLPRVEFAEARKIIVRAILSTDMAQHLEHCARATRLLNRARFLRAAAAAATAALPPTLPPISPKLGRGVYSYDEGFPSSKTTKTNSSSPYRRRKSHYTSGAALELSSLARGGRTSLGQNPSRPRKNSGGRNLCIELCDIVPFDEDQEDVDTEYDIDTNCSISTGVSSNEDVWICNGDNMNGSAMSLERENRSIGNLIMTKIPFSGQIGETLNHAGHGKGGSSPRMSPRLAATLKTRRSSRGKSVLNVSGEADTPPFLIGDSLEDRANLVDLIVHCADLSGQVMTTPLAVEWGERILEEFKNQSELEERLGLPVTFVQINEESEIIRGQLFFLEKIVAPLWEPVAAVFPELEHLQTNLNRNLNYYETAITKISPKI